jgi:hypothetical protein
MSSDGTSTIDHHGRIVIFQDFSPFRYGALKILQAQPFPQINLEICALIHFLYLRGRS